MAGRNDLPPCAAESIPAVRERRFSTFIMDSPIVAFLLVILGGVLQGSFVLPMKLTPQWKWENTWLVYSVSGLVIAPWIFAVLTVPQPLEALTRAEPRSLLAATVFGAGWGIGSVLFGLGVARVGASLAFAIILGMTSAIGALAPMLILHPEDLSSPQGRMVLLGMVIVLVGITLTAQAGRLKEAALQSGSSGTIAGAFLPGLIICLFSGLTSPMLNFALTFGADIARRAEELGASAATANNAIWAPAVTAGAIVNILYCLWLLARNRSAGHFARGGWHYWPLAIAMGAMWMGGIAAYGMGTAQLGRLGASLGWPLFMSTIIVTANVWGAVTREWKGAGGKAVGWMIASLVVLFAAIAVFGYSSTLPQTGP
jgi:L-rhamnose-H+ transport protein